MPSSELDAIGSAFHFALGALQEIERESMCAKFGSRKKAMDSIVKISSSALRRLALGDYQIIARTKK